MKVGIIMYGSTKQYKNQMLRLKSFLEKNLSNIRIFIYDEEWLFKQKEFMVDVWPWIKDKRGGGYWAWKPYIIYRTMMTRHSNSMYDYFLYLDSNVLFMQKPIELLKIIDQHFLKGNWAWICNFPAPNSMWTKRECFIEMGCDNKDIHKARQVRAAHIAFRNNEKALEFVKSWMEWSKKRKCITDIKNNIIQLPSFIDHRHDQSILSILCKKYDVDLFDENKVYNKIITKSKVNEVIRTMEL